MKKIIVLTVCAILMAGLCPGQALSRVFGKITDSQNQPVPNAKITITMKDQPTWVKEVAGDGKGDYEVSFTDGTKYYIFEVTAEGFLGFKEEVKPKIFSSIEHNFTLRTREEFEKQLQAEEMKKNPHLAFFEEGRKAYLAGDLAAARKAFEECIKVKPDYTKVSVFLADIDLKEGKIDEAIARAEKALTGLDEEKIIALRILINANQQKGKKDKATEYQKQLELLQPDSPEALYNQAVEFLNKQDDAQAKPLLEKAIEVDPDFADAHFQLGYLYYRLEDKAACKKAFEQYLKLVPEGKSADEAREMLKWL